MLRMFSTTAIVFCVALAASQSTAQSLRSSDGPAEFPPSSYTGKQYVDSKGCVYVRAGVGGATTWVPRVNRQRKVLCGLSPTFAKAPKPEVREAPVVAAAPAAKPAPAPKPVPTVAKPRPTIVAKPRPTVVPKPRTVATKPRVVATVPRVAPAQRVVVQPPQPRRTASSCPGLSGVSQQYVNSGPGVRCGPQAEHPSAGYANSAVAAAAATGASVEVIRVPALPVIQPPDGYKAAFEDDRFNPNRGKQTREGHAQMRLVWTAGVPRRLVDQNTGRDVTRLFPKLRFPFISLKQQTRYVQLNGWPASSGVPNNNVVVSTKNTAPASAVAAKPTVNGGHRFVQVGTFSKPGNADRAIARLRQLGLPVKVGTYKKKGKTYKIVLAGPFNGQNALSNGLNAARRGGFSDAFTRK